MSVLELLDKRSITYKYQGKDVVIHCLNPEHPDKNPSLRVDRTTGLGHCFSCGFSINLFKYFQTPSNFVKMRADVIKTKISKIKSDMYGLSFPTNAQPYPRDFRGISVELLKEFEAFRHKDFTDRIVFPMRDIQGKIRAFAGRLEINKVGEKRWYYQPGGASIPFFQEKLKTPSNSVFLVEGIFDVLNLYQKGLTNVMGLMGTQTLGSKKKGLNLEKVKILKLQGINRIVLLLDGDAAGVQAAATLEPMLQQAGFDVLNIELEEDRDPGELSQTEVNQLIKYYDKNSDHR